MSVTAGGHFSDDELREFLRPAPRPVRRKRKPPTMSVTRKLPPNPESNIGIRVDCGLTVMTEFQGRARSGLSDDFVDLLCCLMHLCDYHPEYGPFARNLEKAQEHYRFETAADYAAANAAAEAERLAAIK